MNCVIPKSDRVSKSVKRCITIEKVQSKVWVSNDTIFREVEFFSTDIMKRIFIEYNVFCEKAFKTVLYQINKN